MKFILLLSIVAFTLAINAPSNATCLDEAASYAERICGEISNRGKETIKSGSGDISAELQGIIKRIVGSGSAEVNGEVLVKSYENVIRERLPEELVNVRDCRMKMADAARGEVCKRPVTYRTCRHPDFGQSGWARDEVVSGSSGWRGGGYNQGAYCNDVINGAIRARNLGGGSYKTEKVNSSEEGRWTGPFNRDREYNYHCSIKIFWEPVYNERTDPRCGVLN